MNAKTRRAARRAHLQPRVTDPAVARIFRDAASGRPHDGARGAVKTWAVGDRRQSVSHVDDGVPEYAMHGRAR